MSTVIPFPTRLDAGTRTVAPQQTGSDARPAVVPNRNADRPRPSVLRLVGDREVARRTRLGGPSDEPPTAA